MTWWPSYIVITNLVLGIASALVVWTASDYVVRLLLGDRLAGK